MKYLTINEFKNLPIGRQIEYIENLDRWERLDAEGYEHLCNHLGLNYQNFNDPLKLFDAILTAHFKMHQKREKENKITKKYFVIYSKGDGDIEIPFDTEDEAKKKADFLWRILTKKEKEERRIVIIHGETDEAGNFDDTFGNWDIIRDYKIDGGQYLRRMTKESVFDRVFYSEEGNELLCNSTGYEVLADGFWWDEYEDSDGNLYYGE